MGAGSGKKMKVKKSILNPAWRSLVEIKDAEYRRK
jgi:hypothetical protein